MAHAADCVWHLADFFVLDHSSSVRTCRASIVLISPETSWLAFSQKVSSLGIGKIDLQIAQSRALLFLITVNLSKGLSWLAKQYLETLAGLIHSGAFQ